MASIEVVHGDELEPAEATPGITRELAIDADGVQMVRSQGEPGIESGWHHHGDHDIYGYQLAGRVVLEFGPAGNETVQAGPGDFFHIPAGTVHRDVNPDDDVHQEVLLTLIGEGPLVVNVDGPGE